MKNLISILDERFVALHNRSHAFVQKIPVEKLYLQPRTSSDLSHVYSCGELILRSAGAVEQTFNGLTTKLWDDPFEWTLPEALFNNEKISEYLDEVETVRKRGVALLVSDAFATFRFFSDEKLPR
jgi:hypothetical protein